MWKSHDPKSLVGLPRVHQDVEPHVIELEPMEIRSFVIGMVPRERTSAVDRV